MGLTEDQRAMLQLLLQSGQSYADIGSLLGSDVDEVRTRARAAFIEMGGEDPDREVSLTDFLLGQADPIGRADAARHLQADPEANALALKLETQLRLIAPGADLPEIPPAREKRGTRSAPAAGATAASTAPAAKTPRFGPGGPGDPDAGSSAGSGLTGSQKRLIGGLGAGALVVLVVILLVAGVFSGGDDTSSGSSASSGDTTSDAQGASNTTASQTDSQIVRAVLEPVGNADAKAQGVAFFGQIKKTPVLQLVVKGLEPTADGENYSVWLYRSEKAAFRLSGVRVGKSRGIAAQIPVPQQVLRFISDGTFDKIDISLTQDAELKAEAKKDKQDQKLTLHHIGESVMQGPITGPGITTGTGTTGAGGATTTGGGGATTP